MIFDKSKFLSDAALSGMAEAQAELLASNHEAMFVGMVSSKDLEGLRRDMNEQTKKTRLLIDDVHRDMRRSDANLEWRINQGFDMVSRKFKALVVSNTAVILAVISFMVYLFRG